MIIKSLKKSTARKKLCVVVIIAVVIISTLLILETTGVTNFIRSFNSKTTDQVVEDKTNSSNKQDFIEENQKSPNTDNTSIEPTVDDISLSTRRETDGSVTILTELRNYSDGTCDLTIQSGADTYTQAAAIIYQPTFSTCAGFSVPNNTVSHGTWQITLTVTSKGNVNTATTSMEVQ